MKYKKLFFCIFILSLFSFSIHKYYLSLTQINYKVEDKTIQIIINVFMDDIENALNKNYTIDLQLSTKKELTNNDTYFKDYLKSKLQFKIDGITKDFNYIGKEYDGDLVYFYLEIEDIATLKTIEIENRILIEHFPQQQNLIKMKIRKVNKSLLLTAENDKGLLKF